MTFELTNAPTIPLRAPGSQIAPLDGQQKRKYRDWGLERLFWGYLASQKRPVFVQSHTCENDRNLVQYSCYPPELRTARKSVERSAGVTAAYQHPFES